MLAIDPIAFTRAAEQFRLLFRERPSRMRYTREGTIEVLDRRGVSRLTVEPPR